MGEGLTTTLFPWYNKSYLRKGTDKNGKMGS